jgi:hypothetical protein
MSAKRVRKLENGKPLTILFGNAALEGKDLTPFELCMGLAMGNYRHR